MLIKVKAIHPDFPSWAGLKDVVDIWIDKTAITSISPPRYTAMRFEYIFRFCVDGVRYHYGFSDSVQEREKIVNAYYEQFLKIVGARHVVGKDTQA